MTDTGDKEPVADVCMDKAVEPDGATYKDLSQVSLKGCSASYYGNNMAIDEPIDKCFIIKNVVKKIDKLAYVEINARSAKIALRNVPVTWN